MATFSYVQTDTSRTFDVGCSGAGAGASTAGRQGTEGGTAGVTEVSVDPGNWSDPAHNGIKASFVFDCPTPPNVASWAAGNYVIPVNHTTMDGGTNLQEVYVCDYDGSTFQTVVSGVQGTDFTHAPGGTGVVTVTLNRGSAYTPQTQSTSRVFIVLVYQNTDQHGGSGLGITPNQTITTPIVKPAAALLAKSRRRLPVIWPHPRAAYGA